MEITFHYDNIQQVANNIAKHLQPNDVVGLSGDLGAGKTTLTKSFAHFFGIDPDEVTSPTYVYHHIYKGTVDIHHVDLYRIEDEQALWGLGVVDAIDCGGIFFVEWIGAFSNLFVPYLDLQLSIIDAQTRCIKIDASQWPSMRRAALEKVCM